MFDVQAVHQSYHYFVKGYKFVSNMLNFLYLDVVQDRVFLLNDTAEFLNNLRKTEPNFTKLIQRIENTWRQLV